MAILTDEEVYRDDYAKQCFLNIADEDYVSARILYLTHFYNQSLVMMQQTFEKYLKAILLFNSIKHGNAKHDIERLLSQCSGVQLSHETQDVIRKLNKIENIRYRLLPHGVNAEEKVLASFDTAVCDIRRYCMSGSLESPDIFSDEVVKRFSNGRQLFNGLLEELINQRQPSKGDTFIKHITWTRRLWLTKSNILFDNFANPDTLSWGRNSPFETTDKPISMYNAIKEYVLLPDYFRRPYEQMSYIIDKVRSQKGITLRIRIKQIEEVSGNYWYFPLNPEKTLIVSKDQLEQGFTIFRFDNQRELVKPDRFLGIWLNPEDNKYYFDINLRNKNKSVALKIVYGINTRSDRKILAIYNPELNETIRVEQ